MASSFLLDDGSSIASSSILALARKSHLPDPPHFHHGLLGHRLCQAALHLAPTRRIQTHHTWHHGLLVAPLVALHHR